MYSIAAAVVGLSVEKFMEHYANRSMKENPCSEFLGMSGRQLMIDISEDFCKPRFGNEYFGRVAANSMEWKEFSERGYVFSDSGFLHEVVPIVEKFGKDNVTIVQFTGQGVNDFGRDSRTWVRTIRMPQSNDNTSPKEYAELILNEVWRN